MQSGGNRFRHNYQIQNQEYQLHWLFQEGNQRIPSLSCYLVLLTRCRVHLRHHIPRNHILSYGHKYVVHFSGNKRPALLTDFYLLLNKLLLRHAEQYKVLHCILYHVFLPKGNEVMYLHTLNPWELQYSPNGVR